MTHKIMLCFVRSDSDILQASWLNRAAASMTTNDDGSPPFIHSELLFCPPGSPSGTDTVSGLACSIVYSGQVHLESKRFSRKEWFFRSMECSKSQYDMMLQFCQERKGNGFNHLGYFLYWSPLRPSPTSYQWLGMSPRWYCSEIVIGALKHGEILDSSVSDSMHPNELYKMVQGSSMADCGRNMKDISLRFV
jgi:hypothetical protein|tara:strand:+ start:416 stop:991 length:576 start_codon:yes stop_codon:yes gene_type:complete